MKFKKYTIATICVATISFCVFGCWEEPVGNLETPPLNTTESQEKISANYDALYQDVIDDYRKLIDFRLSPNFEEVYNSNQSDPLLELWSNYIWEENTTDLQLDDSIHYHWHCMLADMLDYLPAPAITSFGYMQTDLNGDDIPELVWVSEDYQVFCIFTVFCGQVRLVDAFFPKYKCVILDTGDLYTMRIGGAEDFIYTVSKISDSDSSLITQKEFGKEYGDYYERKNGVNYFIDDKEFEKLYSEYPFSTTDKWKSNMIHFLEP